MFKVVIISYNMDVVGCIADSKKKKIFKGDSEENIDEKLEEVLLEWGKEVINEFSSDISGDLEEIQKCFDDGALMDYVEEYMLDVFPIEIIIEKFDEVEKVK